MWFVALLIIAVFGGIIAGAISSLHNANSSRNRSPQQQNTTPVRAPSFSDCVYSDEERAALKEIQDFVGKESFTHEDFKRYMAYKIDQDFQAMDGWNIWDKSIHEEAGQYERFQRAVEEHLETICYDGTYQIAIVKGSKGDRYLVNYRQCSCPDFRNRHLPCKHMYALASYLDGDVETNRGCGSNVSLTGLRFALAGRFPGNKDDQSGIRAIINKRGGVWSLNVDLSTSAVVVGEKPGDGKLSFAKQYDMILLIPQSINDIFSGLSTGGTQ